MGCGVLIVVDRLPPVKRLLSWWNGCVSNNLGINSMSSKCINRAELIGSSLVRSRRWAAPTWASIQWMSV